MLASKASKSALTWGSGVRAVAASGSVVVEAADAAVAESTLVLANPLEGVACVVVDDAKESGRTTSRLREK
jgi:predicted metal-dependent peptidase